MILSNLKIQGFQSHRATQLQFHPGVNVILGPTDNGKSAIFRAICWALYNRPLGEEFRSYWTSLTKVTTLFKEPGFLDTEIIRAKAKGVNSYWLNGQEFKAFGADVPPDILKAHNLDPELNVQSQISPFFLLQGSSGEVAKYFNKVARLEDIDTVTKRIDSHAKTSRQKVTIIQFNIQDYEGQLERYATLPDIQRALLETEGMETNRVALQQQAVGVVRLLRDVREAEGELERLAGVSRITKQMAELDKLQVGQERLAEKTLDLLSYCQHINYLEQEVQQGQKRLEVLPLVKQALEERENRSKLNDQIYALAGMMTNVEVGENRVENSTKKLQELQVLFTQEMGDQCPLCGQKIGGK